jgi:hypothetical protein
MGLRPLRLQGVGFVSVSCRPQAESIIAICVLVCYIQINCVCVLTGIVFAAVVLGAVCPALLISPAAASVAGYKYIATSESGVMKYVGNVRCFPSPALGVRRACVFDDLLVEPDGRRNHMKMMLVCDNYAYAPYGVSRMGQIARPGSLMALAADWMC